MARLRDRDDMFWEVQLVTKHDTQVLGYISWDKRQAAHVEVQMYALFCWEDERKRQTIKNSCGLLQNVKDGSDYFSLGL